MNHPPFQPAEKPHAAARPALPPAEAVLVTGGTGFVGQQLIRALLKAGHAVTVWTRDAAAGHQLWGDTVRCVSRLADLAPEHACDVVVNLAGARILGRPWTTSRRQALLASREGLTTELVGWIAGRKQKPWLLLSASAIGYYGVQAPGDATPLTESAPPQPEFMSELCQRWEAAAGRATAHGVQVVCMRFGLVLGQGGALPSLLAPVRLGLGGPLGGGAQWMSWIHIDDLVAALLHVWAHTGTRPTTGSPAPADVAAVAYNFTAPGAATQRAFVEAAGAVLHRPVWLPVPAAPVRWMLGAQSDLLLKGQRVVPERLSKEGFEFRHATIASALRDLCHA